MAGAFILVSDIGGGKAFAEINTSGGFLKLFNEYREACRIAGFGFTTIPRKGNAGSVSSVNKLTEELKKVGIEFQLDPTLNMKGVEGMEKLDARSAFVKFMKGENITVVSLGSGNKFTFGWEGGKVYTRKPDEFFIGDLRDSTAEFIGVGCPGSKAFEFTLRKLRENLIPKGMEIWGDSAVLVAQAMPVAVAMEPTFNASKQQQAIIDAIITGKNVQVRALAGCGKTTTIMVASRLAGTNVAYFAFGKAIADESRGKFPTNVTVLTINSFGNRMVRQHYGKSISPMVNEDKTLNIINDIVDMSNMEREEKNAFIGCVKKLVGLVKNTLSPTDDNSLDTLSLNYEVEVEDPRYVFATVRKVVAASRPGVATEIDFDDQIWWPAINPNIPVTKFKWCFVDEAQDLNAAQQVLMMRASSEGKLVWVGDPNQAIYGFRGADFESMETLAAMMEKAGRPVVTLGLTQTRRCPKAVVKLAQELVPDFEALPEAPEGLVRRVDNLEAKVGDMVLCRKNAPLIEYVYSLLKQNIPCHVQGKDIGAGLMNLINRMRAKSITHLIEKLNNHLEKEIKKIENRYKEGSAARDSKKQALQDKIDTLVFLTSEEETLEDLEKRIKDLFTDAKGPKDIKDVVLFSSIHRAKGLEPGPVENGAGGFGTVWILETTMKKRTEAEGLEGSKKNDQENNIRYVGITRAKFELVFVKEKSLNQL